MGKNKKIWMSPSIKQQMLEVPVLNDLIKDFISYLKGELEFSSVEYINVKYVIGRDVRFDRPPIEFENIFHTHILERNSNDYKRAKLRHNRYNQDNWTSNCYLVYCTHWSEEGKDNFDKTLFGILDFDTDGHNFSQQKKWKYEEMEKEFEKAVDTGGVEKW